MNAAAALMIAASAHLLVLLGTEMQAPTVIVGTAAVLAGAIALDSRCPRDFVEHAAVAVVALVLGVGAIAMTITTSWV
ncbi:hypothetical protein [Microbacterium aureliae]